MRLQVLVDTNVLVYAHIHQDGPKQEKAIAVLADLKKRRIGALSVQTLSEFFVTVTSARKFEVPMTQSEAMATVQDFVSNWPVLDMTSRVILEATRGVTTHRMSYWDAQMWAMARLNQIPAIYSEDGPSGAMIEGVRYVNPFVTPTLFVMRETPPPYSMAHNTVHGTASLPRSKNAKKKRP